MIEHGKRVAREGASAMRSRLILEMAVALVSDPDQQLRETTVSIRRQGVDRGPVSLFSSSTHEGVEAVVSGATAVAMLNPSAALTLAYRGTGWYAAPQPLSALAIIPSLDRCVFAVKSDLSLRRLEDIAERKVPLRIGMRAQRDHYLQILLEHVLAAAGFSLDDLAAWGGGVVYAKSGPPRPGDEKFAALASGAIDALFDEGISDWIDAALAAGMTVLPFAEATVAKLEARGYRRAIISSSEYPALPQDLLTLDFSGWAIYVRADADDALVTALCRALDDRKAHIPWDGVGPLPVERMALNSADAPLDVPLHPAAASFWRQRGYLS